MIIVTMQDGNEVPVPAAHSFKFQGRELVLSDDKKATVMVVPRENVSYVSIKNQQ